MRVRHRRFATAGAGVILVMCLGLVGCGVITSSTGTSTTGTSGSCGTPTAPPATGVATGVATVAGTAIVQTGTAGTTPPGGVPWPTFPPLPGATLTPGQITVTTDNASYSACQNIPVVIANGLSSTIYAADHQTSCSIVTLQKQVGDTWQAVAGCPLETPTRLYAIKRDTAVAQTLHPGFGTLRSQSGGWAAGTYRIAFPWVSGEAGAPQRQQLVYSSTFTIT
jgi:hypothetical protein